MKKRKITALILATAMAASLLSGCGGGDTKATTTAAGAEEKRVATENAADSSGKTRIVVQVANDPTTLQPSTINQQAAIEIRMNCFERLFEWDYNGEVSPLLAKEYEWVDDNHLKVIIHDNIKTQTGKAFTASDVKFSLEYAKGSSEYVRHTTNIDFDNIEVVDDYTIVIPVFDKNELFWNDLTRMDMFAQADMEESTDQMLSTPVGTGPYKVVSYTAGVEVVMEKCDDYWNGEDTERQQRNVDEIVFRFIPEEAQRTIALESGEVDFVYDTPMTELEGLMAAGDYEYLEVETSRTPSIYFNSSEGCVFHNKDLRKAVAYAIDNDAIVAAAYKGLAQPARSVVTPCNPEWSDDLAANEVYAFNQDKAKEHLAAAGYQPGELTIRLAVDDVALHKAAAEIIQAYLQQIGINVEISIYDAGSYNSLLTQTDTWDMEINEYMTKGSILFFFGNQINRNKNIRGFWDDEEFQSILAEAMKDGDPDLVGQLIDIYMEEMPIYPYVHKTEYYFYRKGITDMKAKDDYIVFPGDFTYSEEAAEWLSH